MKKTIIPTNKGLKVKSERNRLCIYVLYLMQCVIKLDHILLILWPSNIQSLVSIVGPKGEQKIKDHDILVG